MFCIKQRSKYFMCLIKTQPYMLQDLKSLRVKNDQNWVREKQGSIKFIFILAQSCFNSTFVIYVPTLFIPHIYCILISIWMRLAKRQVKAEKNPEWISCSCGFEKIAMPSHFLKGKHISENPQKLKNGNFVQLPKESNFLIKPNSNKGKISLKRGKQKISTKIIQEIKKQYREENRKQFHNTSSSPQLQRKFANNNISTLLNQKNNLAGLSNYRNIYEDPGKHKMFSVSCRSLITRPIYEGLRFSEINSPITNLSNAAEDEEEESNIFIQISSSSQNSLKQTVLLNNLRQIQNASHQLTFNDDKIFCSDLKIQRQQSNREQLRPKRQSDLINSHLSWSLNLNGFKDQRHLDEGIFNSHPNGNISQVKYKGLLSPVKSLTSLENLIETESISNGEKSEDSKESVVLGKLSHAQLPFLKTFSMEETAAASSMINKIFFKTETTNQNQENYH